MVRRVVYAVALAAVFGFVLGVGATVAHSGCSVTSDSALQTDIWKGDEHENTCDAIGGKDSMFGYALNDDLTGGTGDDQLRGATGSDELREGTSDGDVDTFCDGDHFDHIRMGDSDGADHFHQVQDSYGEEIIATSGDTFHEGGPLHSDCAM